MPGVRRTGGILSDCWTSPARPGEAVSGWTGGGTTSPGRSSEWSFRSGIGIPTSVLKSSASPTCDKPVEENSTGRRGLDPRTPVDFLLRGGRVRNSRLRRNPSLSADVRTMKRARKFPAAKDQRSLWIVNRSESFSDFREFRVLSYFREGAPTWLHRAFGFPILRVPDPSRGVRAMKPILDRVVRAAGWAARFDRFRFSGPAPGYLDRDGNEARARSAYEGFRSIRRGYVQ